jgi:type IV pilus assembly protein PilA
MLYRLRQRSRDESGFTLIELLVVILIIGILAAIAIPSFIGQKSKANDASAKTQARTLQTAMETSATDESGSYKGGTLERLEEIEPTLKDHNVNIPAVSKNTEKEFEVSSENKQTKNVFKIKRDAEGKTTRECTTEKVGGCPPGAKW